jgi:hypothetical protein
MQDDLNDKLQVTWKKAGLLLVCRKALSQLLTRGTGENYKTLRKMSHLRNSISELHDYEDMLTIPWRCLPRTLWLHDGQHVVFSEVPFPFPVIHSGIKSLRLSQRAAQYAFIDELIIAAASGPVVRAVLNYAST